MQLSSNSFFKPSQLLTSQAPVAISIKSFDDMRNTCNFGSIANHRMNMSHTRVAFVQAGKKHANGVRYSNLSDRMTGCHDVIVGFQELAKLGDDVFMHAHVYK
jgi:hypothetical protein